MAIRCDCDSAWGPQESIVFSSGRERMYVFSHSTIQIKQLARSDVARKEARLSGIPGLRWRVRAFQFWLTDQQLPLPTQKKEREGVWFKRVGAAHPLEPHPLPLKNWGGVGI